MAVFGIGFNLWATCSVINKCYVACLYNEVVKIIRRSIMKHQQRQEDILFSVCIFFSAFAINLLIRKLFTTQTLVPMIFVFGVFLISLKTHGYCYGIVSAVLSVFVVNFAFTYP